jgi:hypothetical protein
MGIVKNYTHKQLYKSHPIFIFFKKKFFQKIFFQIKKKGKKNEIN